MDANLRLIEDIEEHILKSLRLTLNFKIRAFYSALKLNELLKFTNRFCKKLHFVTCMKRVLSTSPERM